MSGENPYVYSDGATQQKPQAQEWQYNNNPTGYTDAYLFKAQQDHSNGRMRAYADAMNEYKGMGYTPRGGNKRHNKKSKKNKNKKSKNNNKQSSRRRYGNGKRKKMKGRGPIFSRPGRVAPEPPAQPAPAPASAQPQPKISVEGRIEPVVAVGRPEEPYMAGVVDERDFVMMRRVLYSIDVMWGAEIIRDNINHRYRNEAEKVLIQGNDYRGAMLAGFGETARRRDVDLNLLREYLSSENFKMNCEMLSQLPEARNRTSILDEIAQRMCIHLQDTIGLRRTREFLSRLVSGIPL